MCAVCASVAHCLVAAAETRLISHRTERGRKLSDFASAHVELAGIIELVWELSLILQFSSCALLQWEVLIMIFPNLIADCAMLNKYSYFLQVKLLIINIARSPLYHFIWYKKLKPCYCEIVFAH
jgi:hypothetical protein